MLIGAQFTRTNFQRHHYYLSHQNKLPTKTIQIRLLPGGQQILFSSPSSNFFDDSEHWAGPSQSESRSAKLPNYSYPELASSRISFGHYPPEAQSHEQRRSESASSATGTRVAPVQIIGTLMTWGVSGHCQSGNLSCCSHAGTVRRGPDLEQWHSLSLRVMFEFLTSHGRATRMLSDDS